VPKGSTKKSPHAKPGKATGHRASGGEAKAHSNHRAASPSEIKAAKGSPKLKHPAPELKPTGKAVKQLSHQKPEHAPPEVLPSPVPTDGKPRKNQAGMNARELEHYRALLLAKRRELVGDMSSMEYEALRSAGGSNLSNLPIHMADMGTDNYEQEFTLGLVEKDRQLLREINSALAKIQNGTYGLCEGTGKPISKPRLEAQPWARFSIEHARSLEKGGVRR
jgi:DnaK suppressor protein